MPDRFAAMQAFAAVCDARSFAAAARRLGLSPSVVTRLVASLEEELGVRLIQRTTRSMKLTEAGARYLERARRILSELEEAELSAQQERAQPRGRLVVAAPLLFGRMHVAPLVSRYLGDYGDTAVDLQLSDGLANLVDDGVDVAIRIGDLADSGLTARQLGATRRVLVASPGYLAANGGAPLHPSELVRHRVIAFRSVAPGGEWTFRDASGAPATVRIEPRFSTNSVDAALGHALAGGGIAPGFCYQVSEALRAGSLVEVLRPFAPRPVPIRALFPASRLLSAKVRAFVDLAVQAAPGWSFVDQV